jgi:hypothetical protein
LYWRPVAQLTQTLKLSLRIQATDGTPIRWPDGTEVTEDHFPLHQVAPTSTWLVGQRIRDVQMLRLPTVRSGQPARLQVIVYDAEKLVEAGRWQVALPW